MRRSAGFTLFCACALAACAPTPAPTETMTVTPAATITASATPTPAPTPTETPKPGLPETVITQAQEFFGGSFRVDKDGNLVASDGTKVEGIKIIAGENGSWAWIKAGETPEEDVTGTPEELKPAQLTEGWYGPGWQLSPDGTLSASPEGEGMQVGDLFMKPTEVTMGGETVMVLEFPDTVANYSAAQSLIRQYGYINPDLGDNGPSVHNQFNRRLEIAVGRMLVAAYEHGEIDDYEVSVVATADGGCVVFSSIKKADGYYVKTRSYFPSSVNPDLWIEIVYSDAL